MSELTALMATYRDMKVEMRPVEEALATIEAEIKERVLAGEGYEEVEGLVVTKREGYERQSWDGKGLAGYALVHPEILGLRKVSKVRPGVALKVAK